VLVGVGEEGLELDRETLGKLFGERNIDRGVSGSCVSEPSAPVPIDDVPVSLA
jgi:hypothetical protein